MLRGRKIGLKATMTVEEMKNHLLKVYDLWSKETDPETAKQAIYAKCRPLGLVSNFYWKRYPDAAERLRQAWQQLGWGEMKVKARPKKVKRSSQKACDYLNQF